MPPTNILVLLVGYNFAGHLSGTFGEKSINGKRWPYNKSRNYVKCHALFVNCVRIILKSLKISSRLPFCTLSFNFINDDCHLRSPNTHRPTLYSNYQTSHPHCSVSKKESAIQRKSKSPTSNSASVDHGRVSSHLVLRRGTVRSQKKGQEATICHCPST